MDSVFKSKQTSVSEADWSGSDYVLEEDGAVLPRS